MRNDNDRDYYLLLIIIIAVASTIGLIVAFFG